MVNTCIANESDIETIDIMLDEASYDESDFDMTDDLSTHF